MYIIYIIGTIQAFFLSLLIFSKKNKSTGDYVLGSWLAFIGLHLLDTYFHSTGLVFKHIHLFALGYNFPILQGPFMFVYVLVMINKTGKFKRKYLLHGIPFYLATIYLLYNFYFLSASDKLAYYHLQSTQFSTALKIIWFLKVFVGPVYVILSLYKLKEHTKNITENFSYSEQINLNWLKYVVIGIGIVWLTVLITMVVRINFPQIQWALGDYAIYIVLTAAIFSLGFFGFKQQAIYSNKPQSLNNNNLNEFIKMANIEIEKPIERYKKSGLDENTAKEYLKMLLTHMNKEKPFLNGKLSIKDVAESLNVSINHLSQVINEQAGMNFFDFVNKYRVEEMKLRLTESKSEQFTLLAIALDCGFNSKSSFNSIFKKNTGQTPSEYLKTIFP